MDIEQLTAKVSELEGEVEKQKNINKEVIEKRDHLKKEVQEKETELVSLKSQVEKLPTLETELGTFKKEVDSLKSVLETEKQARESAETKMKTFFIDAELSKAFENEGVQSINTAMALVDRSKVKFDGEKVDGQSVKDILEALKKEHTVLFTGKKLPPTKRAGEDGGNVGYEAELKEYQAKVASGVISKMNARSELDSIRKKYNK